MSTEYRQNIDRISTEYQQNINRISTEYQPNINHDIVTDDGKTLASNVISTSSNLFSMMYPDSLGRELNSTICDHPM